MPAATVVRVPSFDEPLPRVERVHAAVRRVIPRSGCELASALLARELRDDGFPGVFVLGHYFASSATSAERGPLHAWVELDHLVLDPTRDQFQQDPFVETCQGEYVRDGGDPPADLEAHIYEQLKRQLPWKREAVFALAAEYGLDPLLLED